MKFRLEVPDMRFRRSMPRIAFTESMCNDEILREMVTKRSILLTTRKDSRTHNEERELG